MLLMQLLERDEFLTSTYEMKVKILHKRTINLTFGNVTSSSHSLQSESPMLHVFDPDAANDGYNKDGEDDDPNQDWDDDMSRVC